MTTTKQELEIKTSKHFAIKLPRNCCRTERRGSLLTAENSKSKSLFWIRVPAIYLNLSLIYAKSIEVDKYYIKRIKILTN